MAAEQHQQQPANSDTLNTKRKASLETEPLLQKLDTTRILSSLPLQVFMFLNSYYFPAFWILSIAMMIYKGSIAFFLKKKKKLWGFDI